MLFNHLGQTIKVCQCRRWFFQSDLTLCKKLFVRKLNFNANNTNANSSEKVCYGSELGPTYSYI